MNRQVYIREIYNLQSITGPQDLGHGIKLTPVPNDLAALIDRSVPQLGGRRENIRSWMLEAEPASQADWIDGDPIGGLRILPVAMLIMVSPRLKFGPVVFLKIEDSSREIVHEGVVRPIARLKDGRTLDADQLCDAGFSHLAVALRKMLGDPRWAAKTKKEFVRELKTLAMPLKAEFDAYKQDLQCSAAKEQESWIRDEAHRERNRCPDHCGPPAAGGGLGPRK